MKFTPSGGVALRKILVAAEESKVGNHTIPARCTPPLKISKMMDLLLEQLQQVPYPLPNKKIDI
jgi:hypothetical protein